MSTLSIAALVLITLATIAGLASVYRRSRAATIWVPRGARILGLGVSVAIAVMVMPTAWADSGAFALILLGVPVGCCLVALAADVADRKAALVTTLAAVVALVWSLLTVVGVGLYLLLPAVLLAIAAATSWQSQRPRQRGGTTTRASQGRTR